MMEWIDDLKPHPQLYCKHPDSLAYDEACLNIQSLNNPHPAKLYYKYADCHDCDYLEWATIGQESNTTLIVKTTERLFFRVDSHKNDSCSNNYMFSQHGIYGWDISGNGCSSIYVIKPPEDPYYPIYIFFSFLVGIIVANISIALVRKSQWFLRMRRSISSENISENGDEMPTGDSVPLVPSELVPTVRQFQQIRVNSLDTFRGITIAMMVFVNYGGGKYWFFEHSPWNGLTVADLIFPWFAWIMGVGIALSVRSKLRSQSRRFDIIIGIFTRSIMLIILGLFCSNVHSNNVLSFRFPGVLQRLGLSYLIVAFLESVLMQRQPNFQYGRWAIVQDVLDSWVQWIVMFSIVGIHTLITFQLNVPGCPKGYLGPGGLHDYGKYPNCTGGATGFIDRQTFGNKHIYQHPSPMHVYHTEIPFDPEGLLGVLTTCLSVYLGVAAGRVILCSNSTAGRVKRWLIYAIVTGLIGGFLCNWSKEDGLIPINKNLWSLSFVLVTASMAFCMLIVLYLFVDHYKFWFGSPFTQTGTNSIFIYIGHSLTKNSFPFSFSPIDQQSHKDFFIENLMGTLLWIFIAYKMYKKELFITV